MTDALETKFAAIELTASTDGDAPEGTVSGYAALWGEVDEYGDILVPGAFSASLARKRPIMLYGHDQREIVGAWDEVIEDERGLFVKGRINLDTQRGREIYSLLKQGAFRGLSIGFRTEKGRDDNGVRVLEAVDLWEVSFVAFPAIHRAGIDAVKSAPANPEITPSIADDHPTIEEDIKMDMNELKAAIDAAVAPLTAELTETKSALADLETKAARGAELRTGDAGDEHKEEKAAFASFLRVREGVKLEGKAFQLDAASGGEHAVPSYLLPGITALPQNVSNIAARVGKRTSGSTVYKELQELADGNYEWVSETSTRNLTTNPTIRAKEAKFGEISAMVQVSRHALTDASFDVEGYIIRSAKRSFAKGIAAAIYTGDGIDKPEGLFAAGSDVVTETVAAIDYDTIVDLIHDLHVDYRVGFTMASPQQAIVAKIKDENGNPIFVLSTVAGVPSMLMGYPVIIDESAKGITFGDIESAYCLVSLDGGRSNLSILVDPFLKKGYITYYLFLRVGGFVLDEHAVKRIGTAAMLA